MYTDSRKIRNPNNIRSLGLRKPKGSEHDKITNARVILTLRNTHTHVQLQYRGDI